MGNLFLLLILLGLFGVAYIVDQHEGTVELGPKKDQGEKIFSLQSNGLREIHLPNVKLRNFKNQWEVADLNYPADTVVVDNVINRFNNIHVLKEIKADESKINSFFKKQNHFIKILSFEDEIDVKLGDVSEVTGHFYMQVYKDQKMALYLCHDTTFFQGFYKTEVEANLQRYLGFKNLVLLSPFKLIDKRLFRNIDIALVSLLSIDNKAGNQFSLNFESNTTNPVTPPGVRVVDFKKSFELIKDNLKFDKFFEMDNQFLDKKISNVIIKSKTDSFEFNLFAQMNDQEGYFLTYNKSSKIFVLSPKMINLFISKLSDFWVKKLYLPEIKIEDSLSFELSSDGNEWFGFEVYDLNEFKIRSINSKVVASQEISNFNLLLNLVFGQNDFKVSQDLRILSSDELAQLEKNKGLYIKILSKTAFLTLKDGEIYLIDLDKKFLYNYIYKEAERIDFNANQFFQRISN